MGSLISATLMFFSKSNKVIYRPVAFDMMTFNISVISDVFAAERLASVVGSTCESC